jgi:hypothetical protein
MSGYTDGLKDATLGLDSRMGQEIFLYSTEPTPVEAYPTGTESSLPAKKAAIA